MPTELEKMMVIQWKDKRAVTVLSTTGSCNMLDIHTCRGQVKQKPAVIELYNQHMLGVDKMDQLATYYSFLRKSVKWWKSAFLAARGFHNQHIHCIHLTHAPTWTTATKSHRVSPAPHTEPGVTQTTAPSTTSTWS